MYSQATIVVRYSHIYEMTIVNSPLNINRRGGINLSKTGVGRVKSKTIPVLFRMPPT